MPQIGLPFQLRAVDVAPDHIFDCGLFRTLPSLAQAACKENVHLLEYLHLLPWEQLGPPEFYPQLSRKLGDLEKRNLLYPVSGGVFIHVLSGQGEERDLYVPVEPSLPQTLANNETLQYKMAQVEERLLDMAEQFTGFEIPEQKEGALLGCLENICELSDAVKPPKVRSKWLFLRKRNGMVQVTPREFEAIKYLVCREKLGLGILAPLIKDKYIEDISCSGVGPIFLEHKIFRGMKTAITLDTHEELDHFVLRLSEQIKRPVTLRNPIVDATLPDGSRINIVYGNEVSQRGSNFTIRKFGDTPMSIIELIELGTLDYRVAAYLSMVLGEGMNAFVAGETASGKTTLMNALTVFVPLAAKVISIEDTPEVQVPHLNWIREVTKSTKWGKGGNEGVEVSMFDLMKAALRQRPNLIIIGEIRGEEGAIAFQAMQTGHAVISTIHAGSVEQIMQRLTGSPINIPKTFMDNLNVVVLQRQVKLPNGRNGRRATSINEIVGYDPESNSVSFIEIFRWDPTKDTFEFVGDKNSYLLEQKIAPRYGIVPSKKWEIYDRLARRARVLYRLHKDQGVTGYYELFQVLGKAQEAGVF
jgi:flagellar protein FlaI